MTTLTAYPRSNVRLVRQVTPESFYNCSRCAAGEHGNLRPDDPSICLCCGMPVDSKVGDFR